MCIWRILFLFGSVIGQGSSPVKANDPEFAIVAGEVVKVFEPPMGLREATIKILHVYSGKADLKGTTVVQPTADAGSAGIGTTIACPLLQVGEIGIWCFVANNPERMCAWYHRKNETGKGDYNHRIEWAEMVERLDKLKEAERFKLTKELCSHKTPMIARYAVSVLCNTPGEQAERNGVVGFLKALPKCPEVSHSALVELDRVYLQSRKKNWTESEDRKALLVRLTELLTSEDAEEIAEYVRGGARQSLSDYEVSVLVEKILTNPCQSKAVRKIFIRSLTGMPGGPFGGAGNFAFDALVIVIKNDLSDDLRLQAAQGFLLRGPKFSAAQQIIVRKLIADENNADVSKALRAALDKSK